MKSSNSRPSRIIKNPFIHELSLSTAQKVQMGLMSLTVFPLRLLLALGFMMLAWAFTYVGALWRSVSVVEPQTWLKRLLDFCVQMSMRAMWFCCGFHWVTVKGQRADPSEAPILVVAPHSAFFDAITISTTLCSFVTKESSKHVPLWRTIIPYVRPVYVSRGDPDSRKKTVEEIKRRVTSGEKWPQLMIFPEGTCTNRAGLVLFKAGSFIPGLPVQPVVLRYPNTLDTVTWTWIGPGGLEILWLTMCQLHNQLEIEYLPVYTPSQEEKENPVLFASNVRKLMAKALDIPLIDVSFNDCDVLLSNGPLGIFNFSCLLEFNLLVWRLGLKTATDASVLEKQATKACKLRGELLRVEDFAQSLGLPLSDTLRQVHGMFDQKENGRIDYRHYVIALSTVCQSTKPKENLRLAFKMFQNEEDGSVTEEDLAAILEIMLGVENVDLSGLFLSLEGDKGKITYAQLCQFVDQHPDFAYNYIRFKNQPSNFSFDQAKSNGNDQKKQD
ncbi:lysophosphatidylcholine acyltransferase 1 [Eucyclogobius newberryi]|uniref:lysophosphatidylcholine acyltransferase 1 n=1 Tax=Eucyclogobius newberryi TaxID=166745 RepID=UPI003B5A7164